MYTGECRRLSLIALASVLALAASGCYHACTYADERYSSDNGRVPQSDAYLGIQKRDPYLYRYENDWQRNRPWRERHDPPRYYPSLPPPPASKAGIGGDDRP